MGWWEAIWNMGFRGKEKEKPLFRCKIQTFGVRDSRNLQTFGFRDKKSANIGFFEKKSEKVSPGGISRFG